MALLWTPTISLGRDGFSDFSRSPVFSRRPAIRSSYSRPNCARTSRKARSIASRLAGLEKSATGSFANAAGAFTGSAIVLVMAYLFRCLSLQIGCCALDDLASALEHIRRFIRQLAPALVHFAPAIQQIAA